MGNSMAISSVDRLPQPYLAAATEQARLDAEVVGEWLINNLGDPLPQLDCTQEFFVGVALSLKLCRWETQAITAHLAAGLRSGPELLWQVFQSRDDPSLRELVNHVGAAVARIEHDNFLWSADEESFKGFRLAISTDEDEENLLEWVADLLIKSAGDHE